MDTEKTLEEVQSLVKALQESVTAKFAADKEARAKEIDDLESKIIEKIHPPTRKMQWAINGKEEGAKKLYLGQFLKAITPGRAQLVEDDVRTHIKTTLTEGTDATAGYTVPEEYSNEIIKLETQESIIRKLARIFPMGSDTRNIPRQLTNVSVSWTGEGTAVSETNPTFDRLVQTAKKVAALVKMTDELLMDNSVDLDKFIMQLVAEAMGREEDRVAFAGNTGSGDPFMGILYATGVNAPAMAGSTLAYEDVVDLVMSLNAKYRVGATLVTSTNGLKAIMKLADSQNHPLWVPPTASTPATIYGYPYEISDEIPVNLGGGTDETAILFGNFKKHFFVSDRGGYEVKVSDSASDITNSQSAFLEDELWYRFKRRVSLDVALPLAFSKMQVK